MSMPKHVDPWLISMRIEFGWTAQQVADAAGERVEMLIHLLAVHGCPDLAVRLAAVARAPRSHSTPAAPGWPR